MEIIEIIGQEEFDQVLKSNKLVVADFYATWCAPCKLQTPIIHELNADVKDKVLIVKIDVDQNEKTAFKYGVESIPTIIVFKDGNAIEKSVGLTTKAKLSEMLIKHL